MLRASYRDGGVAFLSKPEGNVKIGAGTGSSSPIAISSGKYTIAIGKFTSIGKNLSIIASGGHNPGLISTFPFYFGMTDKKKPAEKYIFGGGVEIGNDVWIGEDVTIMGGVKIGNGVVVGAKSLVTRGKRLKDYGIYAGIPAKLIRFRFGKNMIKKLNKLKWWDIDPSVIKDNWEVFYQSPNMAYKKLAKLPRNPTPFIDGVKVDRRAKANKHKRRHK